jgi:hypothetical protein
MGLLTAVGLLGLVALPPQAHGKGIDLQLRTDVVEPGIGEPVHVSVRGRLEDGVTGPCRRMRVVVVAPGVSVRAALRSLEGRRQPRRLGEWDAFRLASLRSTGRLRWDGALRPNRAGRWTLIIPNWCAAGYVLPGGAERLHLDVRDQRAGHLGGSQRRSDRDASDPGHGERDTVCMRSG